MRRPCLALAALVLAAASSPRPLPLPTIVARPVALDPGDPGRVRLGGVRYLGGWVLTSRDSRFGSISSLYAHQGRFVALSDDGELFRFRMDGRGRIGEVRFQPLPAVPGTSGTKSDRDSESMQHDAVTGRFWVGFEQHNAIFRYTPDLARAEASAEPPAMGSWPKNGGPEAMARLHDGRFIVFAEEQPGPLEDSREALLFDGDPTDPAMTPLRFYYRTPPGFVPTDAGELPDGRVIILNRHYRPSDGLSAAITIIDPRAIAADRVLDSHEIARLAPPLTVDNMEGLSIEQERGRTILWIVSDDNFKAIQRTILLKFALEERR